MVLVKLRNGPLDGGTIVIPRAFIEQEIEDLWLSWSQNYSLTPQSDYPFYYSLAVHTAWFHRQ